VRIVMRMVLKHFRAQGNNTRRVAIAGATELGAKLVRHLMSEPSAGNDVVGFYDDRAPVRLPAKLFRDKPLVGTLDALINDARAGRVDVVHLSLPLRAERRIKKIIAALADTTATVYVA